MTSVSKDLPNQVKDFVTALVANAKLNKEWAICDMEGGKCFADTIPYVKRQVDGSYQISDNYERFFDTIYVFTPNADATHSPGEWSLRYGYSDIAPHSYTYEQAMADASIMFTG